MDSFQLMREASRQNSRVVNRWLILGTAIFVGSLFTILILGGVGVFEVRNEFLPLACFAATPFLAAWAVYLAYTKLIGDTYTRVVDKRRKTWAELHGIVNVKEIPYFENQKDDFEIDFIDEVAPGKLRAYRIKLENGTGVLYDGDGNRVDAKTSAATTPGVTVDDPNSDLWMTATNGERSL